MLALRFDVARELGMTVKQFDESSYDGELAYWGAVFKRRPPQWMASWWQHAALTRTIIGLVAGRDSMPAIADLVPGFDYE